jgi:very-short-patch-repair endonuclease
VAALACCHPADLVWKPQRFIIEIDGPRFHRDKLHDAHKTRAWTDAGYTVRRITSDALFSDTRRLTAAAP